jgi:hypothetical protein
MTSAERRILTIYGFSEDEYSRLRVKAAQHDMTLSKYCYQLLKERTANFSDINLEKNKK